MNNDDMYLKFYGNLNPEDYWNFSLQEDLAKESINYYIFFNNLKVLRFDSMCAPYLFTKKNISTLMEYIIKAIGWEKAEFSPDSDGGMSAVYPDEHLITLDVDKNENIYFQIIDSKVSFKLFFSYEKDVDEVIKYIKFMLGTKVNV